MNYIRDGPKKDLILKKENLFAPSKGGYFIYLIHRYTDMELSVFLVGFFIEKRFWDYAF